MSNSKNTTSIDSATLSLVETRLGRKPRGLKEVALLDEEGLPSVIRVASVVDDKPFPTLFWLIDPRLNLRIDREEATGLITSFQTVIDANLVLQQTMEQDHQRHIALRNSYITEGERELLQARGQWQALSERGIGGIADFRRIRCLHTWYAAHLIEANAVGTMLDAHWSEAEKAEKAK